MPVSMNWGLDAPYFLAAFIVGYLFGSVPFGLILTRLAGVGDIRAIGSGNIGATNVLRTGRKGLAAATLIGDALKGTAAVLVAAQFGPNLAILAGLGAFMGHVFPVWLKFKGGKGVATYIGVLLGLKPLALAIFAGVWLVMALATRYSSLSGLVASAAMPPVLWWLGERQTAELFVVLTLIAWWRHRENMRRLVAGTEARIGRKS